MNEILKVSDLSFKYRDRQIIDNLSFNVEEGSLVSIIGTNACGKTTLIKVLSGIEKSNAKIFVDGIPLNKRNFKRYRLNVAMIIEELNDKFLFDKVIDELRFPLINLGVSKKNINKFISEIAHITKIDSLLECNICELDDLEKGYVLLSAAILHKPKILFIDGIIDNFDSKDKKEFMFILDELRNKYGMTIIYTTNDLETTFFSDRILVLNNGKFIIDNTASTILNKDNELIKIGINIPIMYDLCSKLKFYDLLDKIILDVDELVDILWK